MVSLFVAAIVVVVLKCVAVVVAVSVCCCCCCLLLLLLLLLLLKWFLFSLWYYLHPSGLRCVIGNGMLQLLWRFCARRLTHVNNSDGSKQ